MNVTARLPALSGRQLVSRWRPVGYWLATAAVALLAAPAAARTQT